MKTDIFTLIASSALVLFSCAKEKSPAPALDTPMRFAVTVEGTTKASMTSADLTQFYLKVTGPNNAFSYFESIVKDAQGNWKASQPILWKDEESAITYAAASYGALGADYFNIPVTNDLFTSGATMGLLTDQSTQAKLNAADLLTMASTDLTFAASNKGLVPITLKHGLAKLNIKLTLAPEYKENGIGLEANPIVDLAIIGMHTTFSFKPLTGEVTIPFGAPKGSVIPFMSAYDTAASVATYEAVLAPETLAAGALSLYFTVNGKDFQWTNSEALVLEQGGEYTVPVSVAYNPAVAPAPAGWDGDLAKLTAASTEEYATATDGMTIFGTLGVNKKVSIADGATVTLDNATISYSSNGADFAGLTLLGDGTIVLADGTTNTIVGGLDDDGYSNWPGIYVPEGKTLTINGNDGILNARRGGNDTDFGSPAGIGASWKNPCGNIVINGGVINAVGGAKSAGIGGTFVRTCGDITINGGTITATGNKWGPGIGLGGPQSASSVTSLSGCNITITGGTVTATGGEGAAGIGTGYANHKSSSITITLGNILISGGTVTATGGEGAAGIGTGATQSSNINNCGNITITSGVTSVTATKGSGATNSIGKGSANGTCGTVTIGGVEGAITESPYTYPALPTGIINGLFSVSSTKQVYFSKGNLMYSNGAFSFHAHQYDACVTTTGSSDISSNYTAEGTFDLFGWGTSGNAHRTGYYQPWSIGGTNSNYYAYGDGAKNLYDEDGSADWGANAIGTDPAGTWRTLTKDEWTYLFANHTYGYSDVAGVKGYVIRPDGDNTAVAATYTVVEWNAQEAAGAVFLPIAGRRGTNAKTFGNYGTEGTYWSSTVNGAYYAYNVFMTASSVDCEDSSSKGQGLNVRLVHDAK